MTALLPVAAGGLVWCVGALADVDIAARGLPVLVVVGALALARPRMLLEASAGLCALVAASASVGHAADQPTSLALHLTVAGALVTASSLLHADRRELGWLGGFLLAAATWVRLYDLGVDAPEAYTLPSAVALLAFGLHRLWRVPGASSEVLVPGLALATVPSLLWVLAVDPLTPRALLLGLACLALVMAGTRLGWGAPIVVGAVVGGLVVLRELAPYAEATPRWVLIGLAGTVLTVVGVTWEQRVHRAAAHDGVPRPDAVNRHYVEGPTWALLHSHLSVTPSRRSRPAPRSSPSPARPRSTAGCTRTCHSASGRSPSASGSRSCRSPCRPSARILPAAEGHRPQARRAAGEPGVGNHRHTTADWPRVQTELQTQ